MSLYLIDLDYTLVKPKSGRKFPKDRYDWKFMYPVDRLLEIKDSDIAICTNQNTTIGSDKYLEISNKIDDINKELISLSGGQTDVINYKFIFTKGNKKPALIEGIKERLLSGKYNHVVMVGDAAGRTYEERHKPNDFSDTDFKFLLNIRLFITDNNLDINAEFMTPEMFFEDSNETLIEPPSMQVYTENIPDRNNIDNVIRMITDRFRDEKQIIVMIGPPGCGKTTARNKFIDIAAYKYINNDEKLKKSVFNKLKKEEYPHIIIDNTNPKNYSDYKLPGYKFYIIHFDYFDVAKHLNKLRENPVPAIAYSVYKKNLTKDNFNQADELFTIKFKLNTDITPWDVFKYY